jgi:hypothetical protein
MDERHAREEVRFSTRKKNLFCLDVMEDERAESAL